MGKKVLLITLGVGVGGYLFVKYMGAGFNSNLGGGGIVTDYLLGKPLQKLENWEKKEVGALKSWWDMAITPRHDLEESDTPHSAELA